MARIRLVWKWEDGFEDGESPVGPAWIDTLGHHGKLERSDEVDGGKWIPRHEAIRLARDNGYELLLDE